MWYVSHFQRMMMKSINMLMKKEKKKEKEKNLEEANPPVLQSLTDMLY